MKRLRRILSLIIVLCLIVGLITDPFNAEKTHAAVSKDFEYVLQEDGTAAIIQYTGSAVELNIPEEIDGVTVTRIEELAFKECKSLINVNIPNTVTSIGPYAFVRCQSLKKVNISDAVDTIQIGLFSQCSNLIEISLPDGVTTIRQSAFSDCTGLNKINIPQSVNVIQAFAFKSCDSLSEINYSGTEEQWGKIEIDSTNNANYALERATKQYNSASDITKDYEYRNLNNNTIEITKYKGSDSNLEVPAKIEGKRVISIGSAAFSSLGYLTEINLPEGITSIGDRAFYGCRQLIKINIPEKVTSLGNSVFYDCIGITKLSLPEGVISIGSYTFQRCVSLTEINIPEGVTSVGEGAFESCGGLTEISIPEGVTSIRKNLFCYCHGLKKISIPKGVTSIGESAFYGCSSLTKLDIPKGVTYIGGAAFGNCENLTELYIPEGVSNIEMRTFFCCENLTELSIPEGVVRIGDYAFERCAKLEKVNVPEKVTNIGKGTFIGCAALTDIYLSEGITNIGEEAFSGCESLTEVDIPSNVSNIESRAFSDCTGLVDIRIPNSVRNIGQAAFKQCSSLTNVFYSGTETQWDQITIGEDNSELLNAEIYCENDPAEDYEYEMLSDGTIEITEYTGFDTMIHIPDKINDKLVTCIAFLNNSNLETITIPYSVAKVGNYDKGQEGGLFTENCINLRKIDVESNNEAFSSEQGVLFNKEKSILIRYPQAKKDVYIIPSSVESIGDSAFNACNDLKNITIPSSVTSIGCRSFEGCTNLASVTIPMNVKVIDKGAFDGCGSLKDVYYSGTKKQWDKIKIYADNDELLNTTIHFKDDLSEQTPEEVILPITVDAKQELERLKSGDPFSLCQDFHHYLSDEQIDIMESYLYTWLAEINYTYQYSGISGVRERIMNKAGINPQGDFASGIEQAVTHICVETKYGTKTFEITLDLGLPDHNGNLYPTYSAMHYEILEKESIPSDLPTSGQIGRESYANLGTFVECVRKASENSLHGTYQWELLDEEMTAGVLVDKTVTEIIGNKNGSFSDAVFTIYVKPLLTYSKKVTIACPVDVHVYSMDGTEAGSIVGNKPEGGNTNVRLDVNGDTKTVYLAGNDYYLNLRGTDTGTMRYEVEEIANEKVRRNVQFLELQLEKDMQYEGYVFRPLNIDRDLYALRTVGGSEQKVFHADQDTYQALFRRIQSLSLSQGQTSLDRDKTVQLQASLFPLDASNPNLQWITDNESIIKVDNNGLVTAVGAGRATVTVATKDGSFLKQYCVIDVADGNHSSGDSGSSSGNSSGSDSGNSSGSSGWYGGSTPVPVEQEKTLVVVSLHYVLQFHANGGTGLSRRTMTLLADDSPGIMPKVKRKDYIFDGWYTKQDGGEQVTGDKPLKEAATLYARWTKAAAPVKAPAPALKSAKKGQMQVSLKNVTGAAGYQIEYSASKKFTSAKVKDVGASMKKTISGLKAGKKYYVRLRAYSLDSMKNRIYGEYSAAKSMTVKG